MPWTHTLNYHLALSLPFGSRQTSNGLCYKLLQTADTYLKLVDRCASYGAELAGFGTQAEWLGMREFMLMSANLSCTYWRRNFVFAIWSAIWWDSCGRPPSFIHMFQSNLPTEEVFKENWMPDQFSFGQGHFNYGLSHSAEAFWSVLRTCFNQL